MRGPRPRISPPGHPDPALRLPSPTWKYSTTSLKDGRCSASACQQRSMSWRYRCSDTPGEPGSSGSGGMSGRAVPVSAEQMTCGAGRDRDQGWGFGGELAGSRARVYEKASQLEVVGGRFQLWVCEL